MVDPILGNATPLVQYDPDTWGPPQVNNLIDGRRRLVLSERAHVKARVPCGPVPSCILSLQLKQLAYSGRCFRTVRGCSLSKSLLG